MSQASTDDGSQNATEKNENKTKEKK